MSRSEVFTPLGACFKPPAHIMPDTAIVFGLTKDRFDSLASCLIDRVLYSLGQELTLHPLPECQIFRYPVSGRR